VNFLKRVNPLKKSDEKISWKLIGSINPEVILLGHSHRTTMGIALSNLETNKKIAVLMESSGPYKIPESEYWNFVSQHKIKSLKKIIIIWQGHLSLIDFLFRTDTSYFLVNEKNLSDARVKINELPNNSVVFEKDIVNTFQSHFIKDGLIEIIKNLKKDNHEVILVASPPPKSSKYVNSVLHDEICFEKMYREYFKNGADANSDPIIDESFRVRIWQLMELALKNSANECGARFFPIPSEFMNDEGILLEKYYFGDVSHANEKYAKDLWDALLKNEVI
jgi:hypothetical protein